MKLELITRTTSTISTLTSLSTDLGGRYHNLIDEQRKSFTRAYEQNVSRVQGLSLKYAHLAKNINDLPENLPAKNQLISICQDISDIKDDMLFSCFVNKPIVLNSYVELSKICAVQDFKDRIIILLNNAGQSLTRLNDILIDEMKDDEPVYVKSTPKGKSTKPFNHPPEHKKSPFKKVKRDEPMEDYGNFQSSQSAFKPVQNSELWEKFNYDPEIYNSLLREEDF
jgi:hypothetical protein